MDSAIRRLRSKPSSSRVVRHRAPLGTRAVPPRRGRLARAHLKRGRGVADLAHDLGVAVPTLRQWLAQPEEAPG
jgi:hypothetical protein